MTIKDSWHGSGFDDEKQVACQLKNLRLPANPSKQDIRHYIAIVLHLHTSYWDSEDPRIDKLAQLGRKHIGTLAHMGHHFRKSSHRFASQAINRLSTVEDKPLILEFLGKYPRLIKTVQRFNWWAEAKEIILQRLRENPYDFPREWLKAAVAYGEPSTFHVLEKCLMNQYFSTQVELLPELRKLKGFDLERVVNAIWRRSRYHSADVVCRMLPDMLKLGNVNALGIGVRLLNSYRLAQKERRTLWQNLVRFTGYKGNAQHMREWYDKNKESFRFDKARRKFVLKPRG
ncbi:MAG: hypothetical protein GY757_08695 [bacterium]|nr:hypothetical protein [bacterium]